MKTSHKNPSGTKSDWNVPDWRDETGYPKAENTGLGQWKWEFLRRREDYREDWLTYAPQAYAQEMKEYEEKPFSEINCGLQKYTIKKEPPMPPNHKDYIVETPECLQRYGIPWLMNPKTSEPQTLWVFTVASRSLWDWTLPGNDVNTEVFGIDVPLAKTEVGVLFELSSVPIETQMAEVMQMFPFEMSISDSPGDIRIFRNLPEFLLWPNEEDLKGLEKTYKKYQPKIFPHPNHSQQFVVIMNFAFTFEHQWTFVRTELQSLQTTKVIQKRRATTKAWSKFLQVLDARAEGNTFLEIGKILYPHKQGYADRASQAEKIISTPDEFETIFPFKILSLHLLAHP